MGVSAAQKDHGLSNMKDIICMACVHPAKFQETTSKALFEAGNTNPDPKRTKMDAFWCPMQLQGRVPVADFYSSEQKQDW